MRLTGNAVVIAAALAFTACGDKEEPTKEFTIGAVVGLSGNNADIAYGETVQLATDQMNEALAKEGADFRIKLILDDSQAIPTIAMQLGLDAVQNQGARALVWDTSQDVVVAAQSYYDDDPTNDLGVVLMGGLSSGATITKANGAPWQVDVENWVWRTVMSSTVAAYTAMDVFGELTPGGHQPGDLNGDGVVKVSMFGTNDGLGQPLVADATTRLKANFGDSVVVEQAFHAPGLSVDSTSDWTNFVATLLDSNDDLSTGTVAGHAPDMLFAGLQVLYNVPAYKAYKASGSSTLWMGSIASKTGVFLSELGALAEGAQAVSSGGAGGSESSVKFANDFQAYTGAAGGSGGLYDAVVLLALAAAISEHDTGDIDAVGNDDIKAALPQTSTVGGTKVIAGVDGLRTAIRAIKAGQPIDFDGANGPEDFDAFGDVRAYISRSQVQSGQWVTLDLYDCTQSPNTCALVP